MSELAKHAAAAKSDRSLICKQTFDRADHFLQALRPSDNRWDNDAWLFRGHARSDWHLQPPAWRQHSNPLLPLIDQLRPRAESNAKRHGRSASGDRDNAIELAAWQMAELSVVERFLTLANQLRLPVPGFDHLEFYDLPESVTRILQLWST